MEKLETLQALLQGYEDCAIAFSGGVDSAFLLYCAKRFAPGRVLALTADFPALPREELRRAQRFAQEYEIPLELVPAGEAQREAFAENSPRRCYFCKKALFSLLLARAEALGFSTLSDGSNADDLADFRPGLQAARELSVQSPLLQAGLTKAEIRSLSQAFGLREFDRPACACLASRIPYGTPITEETLNRIEAAEKFLHRLGFALVRVRDHGEIARIEVAQAEQTRLLELRDTVTAELQALGYTFVTLDLCGYRTGSLNAMAKRG